MTPVQLNLKPLREQVYDHMRNQLHTGDLAPGALVNIQKFARTLGISTTPLRDALIQLEIEGFVTILPRKGVKINRLEFRDIEQAYQNICMVETALILSHNGEFLQEGVRNMTRFNGNMKQENCTGNMRWFLDLDLAFHTCLLDMFGNDQAKRWVMPLLQRLFDVPGNLMVPEWQADVCDAYDRFTNFLLQGDPGSAAEVLKKDRWNFQSQQGHIRDIFCLD